MRRQRAGNRGDSQIPAHSVFIPSAQGYIADAVRIAGGTIEVSTPPQVSPRSPARLRQNIHVVLSPLLQSQRPLETHDLKYGTTRQLLLPMTCSHTVVDSCK